ncbi:hypothetical protein Ahy_B06g085429 [Arachis hypogaea]|uniref:Uncharacterized protein n=1 Tax=Arachis hypogaea TaxID=3818 RepID=A0A444YUG7_ARAHY|nr:hypothetical protein Ahy_B06g085429 [Arachis hypogaea]
MPKQEPPLGKAIWKTSKDNAPKMEAQIAKDVVPFNFLTPTRIIRDVILGVGSPAPVVVSEGANTMDIPVSQLPVVVIVFNHGGVYGGDRRTFKEVRFKSVV